MRMTSRIDLSGKIFGEWKVIRYSGQSLWLCECKCGYRQKVDSFWLRSGKHGCQKCAKQKRTKHDMSYSPEYRIWRDIIQRCCNPNEPNYKRYGARGINVCDKWKDSFEQFYKDVGDRPAKGYELDRINNDGDYELGNVRWATKKQNNRNRRDNRVFTIDGVTKCLSEWCEVNNKKFGCVDGRLRRGWGIERALKEPVHKEVWANRKNYLGVEE